MTLARTVEKLVAPLTRRVHLLARRAVVKLVYDDPKMQELQLAIFSGEVRDHVERWEDYGFTSHPFAGSEALVLALGGNTDHCAVVKVADRRFRFRAIAPGEVVIYDDQGQAIHLKRDKTIHIYGVDHLIADVAVDTVVNCPDVTVNADHVTANVSIDTVVNCPDVRVNADHLTAEVSIDTVLTCPDVTVNADHLTAEVSADTTITCPAVTVNAETQITLNTPLVSCAGDLQVAGGISATGTYGASGGKIQSAGDIETTNGDVIDQVRAMSADRTIYNDHDHNDPQGGVVGKPNQQQ